MRSSRDRGCHSIVELIATLWRAELLSVEGGAVSIGTVITALLLLVLGIFLARWSSRSVASLLTRHVGLERRAAAAVQGLTFTCSWYWCSCSPYRPRTFR